MKVAPPSIPRAAKQAKLLLRRRWRCYPSSIPNPAKASTFVGIDRSGELKSFLLRRLSSSSDSDRPESMADGPEKIRLLTEKVPITSRTSMSEDLRFNLSALAQELLALEDEKGIDFILDSASAHSLLRDISDATPCVELLNLLSARPLVALEFFDRRRKKFVQIEAPIAAEEYAKAIKLAGRVKKVDLALEFFVEAGAEGVRTTSTYNALMGTYMYTESAKKCLSLFEVMKRDPDCEPTIITYNILLSVFGRSMLVDHMETILVAIEESNLKPTLKTYNTVIAGYVTAWMWDKMESTFQAMKESGLEPDSCTYLLMLRGYAHQGNLEKMEMMYETVRETMADQSPPLIRSMICAYCKSSKSERVNRVEELSSRLPENQYRPWLNVILIKLYAQEGLVEKMESLVHEAFSHGTVITTAGVMRAIISSYFRVDDLEHLIRFIRLAESAGWRLCRSLYHCQMVMYGQQNRFKEMTTVLSEMEAFKFDPTKKTFLIMYKAFSNFGKKFEAESVIGLMWKYGFIIPGDVFYLS
ncbi:pentatricopeptide repeat-containing protein At2g30780-like [Wolffia australiana]